MAKSKQHRDEQFMLALLAVILMSTAIFLLRVSSRAAGERFRVLQQSSVEQETSDKLMQDLEQTNLTDRPGEFVQLKDLIKDL